jgi:hypothetical protein
MATPMPSAPTGGGPSGGLQWTASIIDQTGQFFQNFNQNVNATTKGASQGFSNLGNIVAPVTSALSVLGQIAAGGFGFGTANQMVREAINFFKALVRAISNIIEQATQATARYDVLGAAINAVGVAAGYTAGELSSIEAGLTAAGASGITARDAMLRLLEVSVDLTKAQKLFAVALDVSVAANTSVEEALRREIHGLATLNPYVFRRLGLIVDLDRANLELARSLGISSDALSIEMKQEAGYQAILRAGEKIRGAWNASMETAGGLAKLMPKYLSDIMVALGVAFQPIYLELLKTFRDLLIESTTWLKTNKDDMLAFGDALAGTFKTLIDFVQILEKIAGVIPMALKGIGEFTLVAGKGLAAVAIGTEEVDERTSHLGETAKQAATILVTAFLVGINTIVDALRAAYISIDAFIKDIDNLVKTGVWAPSPDTAGKIQAVRDEWKAFASDTFADVGQMFHSIQKLGTATGPDELAARLARMQQQVEDATTSIMKLQESLAKDMADLAKRWARADEDEWIKNSRRKEDIERRFQERLEDIRDRYNKRKQQLDKEEADEDKEQEDERDNRILERRIKHQEDLEDIEIDFRRELANITQEYYDEVDEAARNNDAVAVVRAIRERNRKIRDAAKDRDQTIEDKERDLKRDLARIDRDQKREREQRKKDRDDRRQELEDDLKEQLQDAQDARDEDYDNLALSLKREAEDKSLARKRDLEDLEEKHRAERIMLAAHLAGLELIDQASAARFLTEHGTYITTDLEFWNVYWKTREEQAQVAMANIARFVMPPSYDVIPPSPPLPERPQDWGRGEDSPARPYDPMDWGGHASGGFGIATHPTGIIVGEETPEAFAAIPLASMSTMNHNINLRGGISVNGVSRDMESQLAPAIYGILKQFADAMVSRNQQFISRR